MIGDRAGKLPAKFTLYKESASGVTVEGLPSDKTFEAVEVTTQNGIHYSGYRCCEAYR